ncbi:MAG: HEAT repeat domain-containing protein, partial [Deltaproteobacteria bacterium]|nr:HEAT repeat domain-containing protein [Deltaproteobacteria bacterium]
MIRQARLPLALLGLLLLLVAVSEAWGGGDGDAEPEQQLEAGFHDMEGEEDESGGTLEQRRRKVLEQLPTKPDLLINLGPDDLPATGDMVQLGKRATPAILNGLVNNMSPQVRASCASVLTATRDPRAIEPLIDALGDPDTQVVRLALEALGTVENRQATPKLLALLRQPRVAAYVKEEAVRALGQLGDPAAIKPLLEYFLKTWDGAAQQALWNMRRHLDGDQLEQIVVRPLQAPSNRPAPQHVLAFAVERAGELKLSAAVAPLRRLFEDNVGLQNRIVYNLGRIGDKDAVPFLRGLLDRTAEARLMNNVAFALQRLGQDVQPFLAEALADRRAYIRFNAAFVAGDLRLKELVPALHVALRDPNDYVRTEVAVALGKIAAPGSVAVLEEASREWNPIVRRDALLALAAIDYPRFRERVVAELVASKLSSV